MTKIIFCHSRILFNFKKQPEIYSIKIKAMKVLTIFLWLQSGKKQQKVQVVLINYITTSALDIIVLFHQWPLCCAHFHGSVTCCRQTCAEISGPSMGRKGCSEPKPGMRGKRLCQRGGHTPPQFPRCCQSPLYALCSTLRGHAHV